MNASFRPVRGLEMNILNMDYVDGYIYYAIDTHRIYMDANGQNKIPMGGGNSGIYYASKNFTDSADLTFSINDIEGKDLPSVNDLIINYKSGNESRDGFYKVVSVNESTGIVETEYLPVGGGGSGGGSSSGGKIIITPITQASGTTTKDEDYFIEYSLEVYNNADAPVANAGKAIYIVNGTEIGNEIIAHGGKYSFNVKNYLKTNIQTNTIQVKIVINTGGVVDDIQTYNWTVKCIDLKLIWEREETVSNYIKEDSFSLSWKVNSGVDCITHIMIDDGDKENETYFKVNVKANESEVSKTFDNTWKHGAHKFTMWLTAQVGNQLITSNKINHILTFIDEEDITPILTVPFFRTEATQYDTLNIPFLIYKKDAEKLKISFYVDEIEVLTDEYDTISKHYWPYTVGTSGEVKLKIVLSIDVNVFYETTIKVKPLDLGIEEPRANFSLKASEISGNSQLRNNEYLSFSDNFDWVNGGLKTETDDNGNVSNYICIRQGTTMTINYKLFSSDLVKSQGKTFKICFKATNCYDYDALVLQTYGDNEDNSSLHLKLTAQQAVFKSTASDSFNTQYCEDSYIELESEIWPDIEDKDGQSPKDRFLMFWVDGIPANIIAFSNGTSFKQNEPKNIIIGSNQCDVYLYVLKVYERKLSISEHLNNFILDAPNINEKIARFNRNDILGPNGDISYERLITNNPGCHAYLYYLPNGMTTGKEDEKPCNYSEYYNNIDKPILKADDALVFVQGTSSAAYGVAAFNVRTDFGDTIIYDGDGNILAGRKVSENSIPINYTCTKVNVASCENANNALNQEWYNRYQPYYDAHRRKNPDKYRDCMEFDFGIMFIEDHNQNDEYTNDTNYTLMNVFAYDNEGVKDSNYIDEPYYKQYAVANMGNDKKNLEVFHDIENPKACCVEVLDNQNAQHWMTVNVTTDDFVWSDEDTGFYEFRYSVKKCKGENPEGITEEVQAQNFVDFVNWMASCDPNPYGPDHPNGYTGAPLDKPITFETKVFTGGYAENEKPMSGVSLKGFEISKYSKEYTHDTEEYRIAKFLNECEDHLIMDSVVYHYLFIQRHTMVDNVAKNTFWSTEDGIHWDLTKNYDNDTADGNDNSGYLKYSYGYEILEKGKDRNIFNANQAVWLNTIKRLPEVQEDLYKKLQNRIINGASVWDSKAYLKLFKEKQSLIPERCYIEDYFRKYIRPRRLGLDSEGKFLQRLEGGLKTHQREQYETYQAYYIDSLYCSGGAFNDTGSFDMRLNKGPGVYQLTEDTSVQENKQYFEKKTITDLTGIEWEDYVLVIIPEGENINPSEKEYYELVSGGWTKEENFKMKYYIDLYPSAHIGGQIWRGGKVARGTETSIPVGQLLDSPTDATCYIYASNMIQSIKGIEKTYPNYIGVSSASKLRELEAGSDDENYFNERLNRATINSNTQMEKALLQNVGSSKLEGLDLSRLSMLRELKIDGSTFPYLILAEGCIIETLYLNPLNSFTAKELLKLNDFKYNEEIFNTLKIVNIQNCPAMNNFTYEIAKANYIENYCFNDISWEVPTADLTRNEKGQYRINAVENLLNKYPVQGIDSQALALTGVITIELSDDLPDNSVDEFDIYNTYKKTFPNLAIKYSGNLNALKKAYTITFYNDENKQDIIYEVKTNGAYTLDYLTSVEGPLGVAIDTPSKEASVDKVYIWNGNWIDEDGNINTNEEVMSLTPSEDKDFIAQYNSETRTYTISLRDWDGSEIEHSIGKQPYNKDIGDLMPIYLYREHDRENWRYEFKGWISATDYLSGKTNVEIITDFIVTGAMTYYAFYQEQNCLETPSRLDYFEFTNNGQIIHLKSKYKSLIKEPITLPIKNDDTNITTIGSFAGKSGNAIESYIPSIYILDGQYTTIEDNAFYNMKNLKYIYLSNDKIIRIGNASFENNNILQFDDINKLKNITYLGVSTFNNNTLLELNDETFPTNLKQILDFAFSSCPNVNISDFTRFSSIGYGAFSNSGKSTTHIILDANIKDKIGYNAFSGYGSSAGYTVTVYNANNVDDLSIWLNQIGLSSTTVETPEGE